MERTEWANWKQKDMGLDNKKLKFRFLEWSSSVQKCPGRDYGYDSTREEERWKPLWLRSWSIKSELLNSSAI